MAVIYLSSKATHNKRALVEKNREELPVLLSLSYIPKWIYHFQALTCPS